MSPFAVAGRMKIPDYKHWHKQTADSPDVNEGWLPSTPPVAQEQLGALEAAMIKVGWLAAVGAVDASEALGHRFSRRLVNDGQVGDGCFGSAGFGFWQVLLQGRGLVCQPGHHKVVGHTVTLVLDHGWAYLGVRWEKIVSVILCSNTYIT